MMSKWISKLSLELKVRLRRYIRIYLGQSDSDAVINHAFLVGFVFVWLFYLIHAFYPNPPVFNTDIDPIFEYRDTLRGPVATLERNNLAHQFFHDLPSKHEGLRKEIDVCPIIIAKRRPNPNWLWLVKDLLAEDEDMQSSKQALVSHPTVLWRDEEVISAPGFENNYVDKLIQKRFFEVVQLGSYSWNNVKHTKHGKEFEDHSAAWTKCSEKESECRYCMIIEDNLEVAEKDFRRFLYEVLVLGDRNSLDWGVISLNPISLEAPWINSYRTPLVIVLIFGAYLIRRRSRKRFIGRAFAIILLFGAVWLFLYQPNTLVPPPKVVSFWYPTQFYGNAYLIKPKDGKALVDKAQSALPELKYSVNNLIVRHFRSIGRGDLKMLTGSLRLAFGLHVDSDLASS